MIENPKKIHQLRNAQIANTNDSQMIKHVRGAVLSMQSLKTQWQNYKRRNQSAKKRSRVLSAEK